VVPGLFDQLGFSQAHARAEIRATARAGLGHVCASAASALHDFSGQFEKLSRLVLFHCALSS
jgi:hypothetical protein